MSLSNQGGREIKEALPIVGIGDVLIIYFIINTLSLHLCYVVLWHLWTNRDVGQNLIVNCFPSA